MDLYNVTPLEAIMIGVSITRDCETDKNGFLVSSLSFVRWWGQRAKIKENPENLARSVDPCESFTTLFFRYHTLVLSI